MNLTTDYLGIQLPHPLIVGSGPLTDDIDTVKELVDSGAAALVLRSLYEEEITGEQMAGFFNSESYSDSFAEASSYQAAICAAKRQIHSKRLAPICGLR